MQAIWAALAALVFATSAGAQQRALDMRLVDAGFKMRPAVTPKQIENLQRLPAHRFVPQTAKGRRYYVYADPTDCKCAFVGDEGALQAYRDMRARFAQPQASNLPGGQSPEGVVIHEMNDDLTSYDDNLFSDPF